MENSLLSYIKDNLERIKENIAQTARRVGVPAPKLVGVTKSATDREVCHLVSSLGLSDIAENRVQMFTARSELFTDECRPNIHLIGSLQTNKVKYIAKSVALIHALDSERLALEIEKQGAKISRKIPVLVEVNSGKEENKGGVFPEDTLAFCEKIATLPHLSLEGLMTMAPICADPLDYRPYFRNTKKLFDSACGEGFFATKTPVLSMGMSDSFIPAIEEGSTLIRVGRALFVNKDA